MLPVAVALFCVLPLGFVGLFVDPDDDQWTATVSYGDGSEAMPLSLNEDQSFSLVHTYDQPGVYTVVVRVSDGKGGEATSSFQVSVVDRSAPVVELLRAYVETRHAAGKYETSPLV